MTHPVIVKIAACVLVSAVIVGSALVLAPSALGQIGPSAHSPDHPGAVPAATQSLASASETAASAGPARSDSILPQVREPGEPEVTLHAGATETTTGDTVEISLSVHNPTTDSGIDVSVVLAAPPGVLLRGDNCVSAGQCADAFELRGGGTRALSVTAIANQSGLHEVNGFVAWSKRGGGGATMARTLQLKVRDPAAGEPHVSFNVTRTEVDVGDPVNFKLAATNSIATDTMTLTLLLDAPSGWVITGAGFADTCGSHCSSTYTINPGRSENFDVSMVPNELGGFDVKANLVWYIGTDRASTVKEPTKLLHINVIDPTQPVEKPLRQVISDLKNKNQLDLRTTLLVVLWTVSALALIPIVVLFAREVYRSI